MNKYIVFRHKPYHGRHKPTIASKSVHSLHGMKSVRIRSFSGPHFPAFGDTPYLSVLVRMRENTDQKNSEYRHFSRSVSYSHASPIWRSLDKSTYNPKQNVWNKVKKFSKIGQYQKGLIYTFGYFLNNIAKILFWKNDWELDIFLQLKFRSS